MNYKTLMAKIAAYELKQKIKQVEPKPAPVVEETPHKIVEELPQEKKESKKVEEEIKIKAPAEEEKKPVQNQKKKTVKKPVNRAYMVVENIEQVNENSKETEKTELEKEEEIDF